MKQIYSKYECSGRLSAFARRLLGTGAVLVGAIAPLAASAEIDFPQRPIQLIVGYAAGGSTDSCARALAHSAEDVLKQPVIIQNKPGAASAVSIGWLKTQKPDGYTIAILSTGAILNQLLEQKPTYDVRADLSPIALVAQYQVGMVVRKDSPWRSISDVMAAAKTKADSVAYATAGQGTPQHLTMERLAQSAGIKWVHVPYKSGPEAITALLRGDVSVVAQSAEWLPYVRDGRLRLISFFQDERMKGYDDVPTLKESGFDLVAPSLLGVVAPKGTPEQVVGKLQNAFRQAASSTGFKQCSDLFGIRVDYQPAEEFSKRIRDTVTFWEPTGREVGKAMR